MPVTDTIAAIATAPGEGSVAIVRLSGPEAEAILMRIFRPAREVEALTSHLLTYGRAVDGAQTIDECMAVLMRAPRSYTREDVAELQLHGGSAASQRVLALCLREGARLAEPGEFTRRAFLNGRIDLSQAEAVMALIAARGEASRQAAVRQLQGGASQFIHAAADTLYGIQASAAACIDYPEEVSEEEAAADLGQRIGRLADQIDQACDERAARILTQGLSVALCGEPNVGKSSLLNALLGEERAIVTPIPGTTRDMVTGDLTLAGSPIHLTDTAGLHATDDPVERIGVERARRAIASADAVLAVTDASRGAPLDADLIALLRGRDAAVVVNKSDLVDDTPVEHIRTALPEAEILVLSAQQPGTLDALKAWLARKAAVSDALALTQPRHIEAARRAASHLRQAREALALSVDMATIDLQAAQLALAEITGDAVEEKLLDRVFSEFCVGK